MLGVTLGSDLSWNDHIISVAKAAGCKLGFLFRTKRFFTPTQLLTLYKAQIRPRLEYCCSLWRGASKHSLNTLDAIQRRAIRLIGGPALTDTHHSLAHRRSVSALSLFYRYYHGFCFDEIKSIIPPKASFARNTRFSKIQHSNALKLDINQTNAFANSFIPMTSRDWNSLPPTVFPTTYNLQSFKTSTHRYLRLLPNP